MDKKKRRRKDGGKTVMRTTNGGHDGVNAPSAASSGPVAAPGFDPERYRRHIDHLDMPDDSKADLLRAVWQIMQSFVDRAFGDDPAQLAIKARAHVDAFVVTDEPGPAAMVTSLPEQTHHHQTKLASAFRQPSAGPRREEEQ